MQANMTQIDGSHYKNFKYQVWDFVTDLQMPFILGSAVKYVVRFKEKNGISDLKKAIHYLEKAIELNMKFSKENFSLTIDRFCYQLDTAQYLIIFHITLGNFKRAIDRLTQLISDIEIGTSKIE